MKPDLEFPLLSWKTRILLLLVAAGATAAYAASFFLLPGEAPGEVPRVAAIVGISAALSWPVFGAWLVFVVRIPQKRSAFRWADICLGTMVRGNAVLGFSIGLNLLVSVSGIWAGMPGAIAHLIILASANLTMVRFFKASSAKIGVDNRTAILAWFAGLNLPFILILLALWNFI